MFRAAFLLALCAAASAGGVPMSTVDHPEYRSPGWTALKRADGNTQIRLVVAVKQTNVAALEATLMAVSDPQSARYGQWLTNEEVHAAVAPAWQSVSLVTMWLAHDLGVGEQGVERVTMNGDFLAVMTTIAQAEQLLRCEYWVFEHEQSGERATRVLDRYMVPHALAAHLDFVAPTLRFPAGRARAKSGPTPMVQAYVDQRSPEAVKVTPSVLKAMYKTTGVVGGAAGNKQGVASFVGQRFSTSDLQTFWKEYSITPSNVTENPNNTAQGHGDEADLDTQYITAMGEGISTQVWYTKGSSVVFPDDLLNWITDVATASDVPWLFSVSYGDDEQSVGLEYGTRINTELVKSGARGISVLFASGDSGCAGVCRDGNESPDYPASSPYVTSVGSTDGGNPGASPTEEKAVSFSGGGFSNYFGQPAWQADAVSAYLSEADGDLPDSGKFNASGRGYPDVSAQGVDFVIVDDGRNVGVSGTSCSSPTVGGIIGLLNDLRVAKGMATLGYLNPMLYQLAAATPDAFNDVTEGENEGCGPQAKGFPAMKGWDPVSGWGTPDYAVLAQHLG